MLGNRQGKVASGSQKRVQSTAPRLFTYKP